MSKAIKTQGNFMVFGPEGERRAAFALDSDRQLFLIAEELKTAFVAVMRDLEEAADYETVAIIGSEAYIPAVAILDKIWAMEPAEEEGD